MEMCVCVRARVNLWLSLMARLCDASGGTGVKRGIVLRECSPGG